MELRITCHHTVAANYQKLFESQLVSFAKRGWDFYSLSTGLELLQQNNKGKGITISFDDGDATVCTVAQPVLDSMGIKAMLYLSTDYVEKGQVLFANPPAPAVTWQQLENWLKAGHEIGSHTHTHRRLTECSAEEAIAELDQSRRVVKNALGIELKHFSYPWGQVNSSVEDCIKQSGGWHSAATIDRGWNQASTNPLALKRDLVEPEWPQNKTRLRFIQGDYPFVYKLQRVLRNRKITASA